MDGVGEAIPREIRIGCVRADGGFAGLPAERTPWCGLGRHGDACAEYAGIGDLDTNVSIVLVTELSMVCMQQCILGSHTLEQVGFVSI